MFSLLFNAPITFCLIVAAVYVWSNIYAGRWDPAALSFSLGKCIDQNQWYRVFTSFLVHKSPLHLLVNTLALWACLGRVEDVYGSWFVFRYTVLLVFLEALFVLFWVRMAVEVFRERRSVEQWCTNTYARLSCRGAISVLRSFTFRGLLLQFFSRIQSHFRPEAVTVSEQSHPLLQDPFQLEETQGRHPFSLVRSHPLTIEPVCGMGGVCLAWLVFAVTQVGSGPTLMPPSSAGEIAFTQNYIHSSVSNGGNAATEARVNAAWMAKIALANTGYPIFGLFNLDPSLAPLVFMLIARVVTPVTPDSEGEGPVTLLAHTTSGVRYLIQSISGFLLGLFLGGDVITVFLPNVYWTLCFFGNCALLSLNSLASNNASFIRRILASNNNGAEPLLLSRGRSSIMSNNIFGLDLNPALFDCPSSELLVPKFDFEPSVEDGIWQDLERAEPSVLSESDTGYDSNPDLSGSGMVQRFRSPGSGGSS